MLAGTEQYTNAYAMDKSYYAKKLSAERLQRVYEIAGLRVRQYLQAEIDHLAGFVKPGDRILELGCGYGRVLAPLAAIAGQGWGVDNSPDNLELASALHPELRFSLGDAASLDFTDQSFDLVFGVQNFISACKVPPEALLHEALRVTRPGGLVFLSSYAAQFWPHRLEWFRRQAEEGLLGPIDDAATGDGVIVCKDGFRATTFSPADFAALAKACGVDAKIYLIDQSSVFCEIQVPAEMETPK
jgi:SAM-dependent methyltransferase